MVSPRARALIGAAAVLLALALSGCSSQGKVREDDLAELLSWLPGHYDTVAQAQRDEKSAIRPGHDRLALLIVPVYVPRIGHHVFFVEEMADDNAERVMSERLFSFDIDEKRGIIGLMYNFIEPLRWRGAPRTPQMLTSVMSEDVAPVGCELIWTRKGETFTAYHDPQHCHRAAADVTVGPEAQLTPNSLKLGDFEFKKTAH
jgi:outer membrane murein-binding lipoprotein Lpp